MWGGGDGVDIPRGTKAAALAENFLFMVIRHPMATPNALANKQKH